MRILNLAEEFLPGFLEELQTVDVGDVHWIKDAFQGKHSATKRMKTVLVALHDKPLAPDKRMLSTVATSLLVQYFASGNCGFVKLLRFNDASDKGNDCTVQIMREAITVLNQYAQQSGYQKCNEIFSMVTRKHKFTMADKDVWSQQCRRLYAAGFRLIDNCNSTSHIPSDICLLVYKPGLIPNFQVEDGVVGDRTETSVILNFCEHLVSTVSTSDDGKQEAKWIHNYIETLKESSNLMLCAVRSSFPWNGQAGPSPDNQVAIVGGGLAGLAAAASLSKAGCPVVLLEAANYLGGRVKQAQPFEGFGPFDVGGEFIHGTNTVVNKLALDNGWLVLPAAQCEDGDGEKIYYKGKLYSLSSDQPEIKAARKTWNEIINSRYKCQGGEDGSLPDSLKIRLQDKGLSQEVLDIIEFWKLRISAGSLTHYGVREGRRRMESKYEWGLQDCRLAESYSQLVKYYLDNSTDVDKRLNWQVKNVIWKDEDRIISNTGGRILLKNQHGDELTANYVIITVPLTILKDGDITFVPALPAEKSRAIDRIQMLGAWKIVCRFKFRFWPEKLHQVYCVRGFASELWMWSRDSPGGDDKCHVIVGFETADSAEQKSALSGEKVLEGFLNHLDEIFGTSDDPRPATDSFMNHAYFHWSNHPFIRGGYTSPTAHAYDMRHVLASPVEDRVFFAGEATSLRSCSTVPTAIETGLRAADQLCLAAGKSPCAEL